jgi:hypothetical protein
MRLKNGKSERPQNGQLSMPETTRVLQRLHRMTPRLSAGANGCTPEWLAVLCGLPSKRLP